MKKKHVFSIAAVLLSTAILTACSQPKQQVAGKLEVKQSQSTKSSAVEEKVIESSSEVKDDATANDKSTTKNSNTKQDDVKTETSSDQKLTLTTVLKDETSLLESQDNNEPVKEKVKANFTEFHERLKVQVANNLGYDSQRMADLFFNYKLWKVADLCFLLDQGFQPQYEQLIVHKAKNQGTSQFLLPLTKDNEFRVVKGYVIDESGQMQLDDLINN